MLIYLRTWLFETSQGVSLTKAKYKHRLLSFFHTKDKSKQLKNYVKTGMQKTWSYI